MTYTQLLQCTGDFMNEKTGKDKKTSRMPYVVIFGSIGSGTGIGNVIGEGSSNVSIGNNYRSSNEYQDYKSHKCACNGKESYEKPVTNVSEPKTEPAQKEKGYDGSDISMLFEKDEIPASTEEELWNRMCYHTLSEDEMLDEIIPSTKEELQRRENYHCIFANETAKDEIPPSTLKELEERMNYPPIILNDVIVFVRPCDEIIELSRRYEAGRNIEKRIHGF